MTNNPKVVGSNPTPATKTELREAILLPFIFMRKNLIVIDSNGVLLRERAAMEG